MAQSEVALVNNALALVGADFITSLTQSTKSAVTANQIYPGVRDAVLRAFTWNCAEQHVILAPLGSTPPFKWAYEFQLPSDCLRVVSLENDPEYKVSQRKILANTNALYLTYIYRLTDVAQFDPLLSSAIEARLASELAFPLVESKSLRDDMWAMYTTKLREAKGVDSREKSSSEFDADVWVRNSGRSY